MDVVSEIVSGGGGVKFGFDFIVALTSGASS
jgi:hypothetical protein